MVEPSENVNGLEVAVNGKMIKASGLFALILVLTVAPIGLSFYLSYNIVEAMGEQKKDFAAAIAAHDMIQTKRLNDTSTFHTKLNERVVEKQDAMIERLDENNFLQSLSPAKRDAFQLRMPSSMCKKLERRNC